MNTNQVLYSEHVDASTRRQVNELLEKDPTLDELWVLLGESYGLAATGEDPKETGKKFFASRLDDIRAAVCGDKRIRAFAESDKAALYSDLLLMVTGKLISEDYGGNDIPVAAFLAIKVGLLELCESKWTP